MAGKCHQIGQCAAFGKFRDKILITLGSTGLETFTFDCERVCQEIKALTAAFAKHVSYVKKKKLEKSQKGNRCKSRYCEEQSTSTESETHCEDEFDSSQYELSEADTPRRVLRSDVKSTRSKGLQRGSSKRRRALRNVRRKSSSKSESGSSDKTKNKDDSDDESIPISIVNIRKRNKRKLRVVISSDGDGESEVDAPGYAKFSTKVAESYDRSCQDESTNKAVVSSPVSFEDEEEGITTADKEQENLTDVENNSRNVGSFIGESDCPFRIKMDLFEDHDADTEDDKETDEIVNANIQDKSAGSIPVSRPQKSSEDLRTQEIDSNSSSKDNATTRRHSLKGYKIPRLAQKFGDPSPESSLSLNESRVDLAQDFRLKSAAKSARVQDDRQRRPKNIQNNHHGTIKPSNPAEIKCEQEVWILETPNQVEVASNVSLNDSGFNDHENITVRLADSRTPPAECQYSNVEQHELFGKANGIGATSDAPPMPGSSRRARHNSTGVNYAVTGTGIRYEIPRTGRQLNESMSENMISGAECPDYRNHKRSPSKSCRGHYRGRYRNLNHFDRSKINYRKKKFDPLSAHKYRQRSRRQNYFRGNGYRQQGQYYEHTHHRQDDPAHETSGDEAELRDISDNSLSNIPIKSSCQSYVWIDGFGNSHDPGK